MNKYAKGDYINTIPLQTVIVKRRIRDERNKLWYKVETPSKSIFYVTQSLTKGLANPEQIASYKQKQKTYET